MKFVLAGLVLMLCEFGLSPQGWSADVAATEPESLLLPKDYVLAANDLLEVKVYQEEDLSGKIRISQNGTATLPLIGPLSLAGKSPDEATKVIHDALADGYLVSPKVTLTVLEHAKRHFSVLGQVQRPGTYEIEAAQTISIIQALAMAGGVGPKGDLKDVTVMRPVPGRPSLKWTLNVDAMVKKPNATIFEVQADDTIRVGETIF